MQTMASHNKPQPPGTGPAGRLAAKPVAEAERSGSLPGDAFRDASAAGDKPAMAAGSCVACWAGRVDIGAGDVAPIRCGAVLEGTKAMRCGAPHQDLNKTKKFLNLRVHYSARVAG